ncbi:MAG: phosphoglycolate phosphatase [Alphaproteobacteria bacterium]|nr:phosphoglycolate phosphatase [Alphaproteobacteria bacterium]
MTAVIFDLDGTLIDSVGAVADIANTLMRELNLPPLETDEARSYVGNGAERFLERALTARDALQADAFKEHFARFNSLYAAAPGDANEPFRGADAALRQLACEGYQIGLCTNKPLAPTLVVLKAMGWEDLMGAVIAGDVLPEKKPDPAPLLEAARRLGRERAIFVGDSEVDAETAAAAGLPLVLYTEGYRKSPIEALVHARAFSQFSELPGIIGELSEA